MSFGKFFNILRTMAPMERKLFHAFLSSPYPTNQPLLVRLYEIVLDEPDDQPLDRERLWHLLYHAEPRAFRDDHMRKHLSDLAKSAEQFLIFEAVRARPEKQMPILLQELRQRNLDKYFSQHYNIFQKKYQEEQQSYQAWEFWNSFAVEWEKYEYDVARKRTPDSFQSLEQSLHFAFAFFQISLEMEQKTIKSLNSDKAENSLDSQLLMEAFKQAPFANHSILQTYILVLELMKSRGSDEAFREKIETLIHQMDHWEGQKDLSQLAFLYGRVINELYWKIMTVGADEEEWYHERLIDLTSFCIEHQMGHENGYLREFFYKNFATILFKARKLDRAYEVIHKYKDELAPEIRENAFNFNLAAYHYYKKNYPEALKGMQKVAFDDHFYSLDARTLTMKIYLETGAYPALESFLDSFKRFISRHKKLTSERKKRHINRIKYIRQLYRIISEPQINRKKLERLKQKVVNEPALIDQSYLLGQIGRHL